MDKKATSVNDLMVVYGVSVASVILAIVLGATTIAGAIALFTDNSLSLPSIFGVLGGNSYASLMTSGILATLSGVMAHLGLKKIATDSSIAAKLVDTDNYKLINKTAKTGCFVAAVLAGAGACGALLATLLSITSYTDWGACFLGQILPMLFIAGAFAASGVIIDKLVKAELKPNVIAMIAIIIAAVGLLLAFIAVPVKAHSKTSSTYNSIYNLLKSY